MAILWLTRKQRVLIQSYILSKIIFPNGRDTGKESVGLI